MRRRHRSGKKGRALADKVARVARALAAEHRVAILMLLSLDESLGVCELAEELELSQPAVSQHLRVLKEAGLVEPKKRANFVYYQPVPGAIESWNDTLCTCCCVAKHSSDGCCEANGVNVKSQNKEKC